MFIRTDTTRVDTEVFFAAVCDAWTAGAFFVKQTLVPLAQAHQISILVGYTHHEVLPSEMSFIATS
jgi:hypothetical protein